MVLLNTKHWFYLKRSGNDPGDVKIHDEFRSSLGLEERDIRVKRHKTKKGGVTCYFTRVKNLYNGRMPVSKTMRK